MNTPLSRAIILCVITLSIAGTASAHWNEVRINGCKTTDLRQNTTAY
jgi:hypothetical protein